MADSDEEPGGCCAYQTKDIQGQPDQRPRFSSCTFSVQNQQAQAGSFTTKWYEGY